MCARNSRIVLYSCLWIAWQSCLVRAVIKRHTSSRPSAQQTLHVCLPPENLVYTDRIYARRLPRVSHSAARNNDMTVRLVHIGMNADVTSVGHNPSSRAKNVRHTQLLFSHLPQRPDVHAFVCTVQMQVRCVPSNLAQRSACAWLAQTKPSVRPFNTAPISGPTDRPFDRPAVRPSVFLRVRMFAAVRLFDCPAGHVHRASNRASSRRPLRQVVLYVCRPRTRPVRSRPAREAASEAVSQGGSRAAGRAPRDV